MASIVFTGRERMSAPPPGAYRIAATALAMAVALFCVPTLLTLHDPWSNSYYSDGYPVAVLAAILFVHQWWRAPLPADPSVLGLAALAGAAGMTLAGHAADILIVPQMLLPVLLLSAIWTAAGTVGLRRFAPSLLFLYFAIPFWRDLEQQVAGFPDFNEQLRLLSTLMVSAAVRAVSIPAYIHENLIHISSGTFEIAEGCSGRVYLTAAVELALFFGFIELNRWRSRLILLSVAAMLALLANWLRIFVLIMIGHYTEMQSPLIDDHANFGWLLFLAVIAPIVLIVRRLAQREEEQGLPDPRGGDAPSAGSAIVPGAAFALVAAAGLGLWRVEAAPRHGTAAAAAIALPGIGEWVVAGDWDDAARPAFEEPDAEAGARYRRGTDTVHVYVVNYAAQWQGHEIVFHANRPEGPASAIVAARGVSVEDPDDGTLPFAELDATGGDEGRRLVWFGLRVAGTPTASRGVAKALQALGALRGRTDAQALVISADCAGDCELARAAVSSFAQDAAALLYRTAADAGKPIDD